MSDPSEVHSVNVTSETIFGFVHFVSRNAFVNSVGPAARTLNEERDQPSRLRPVSLF